MKTERIFPYQLEEGDLLLVRPKTGPSFAAQIVHFKRTRNSVSYTLNGQFYHWATLGKAREGLMLTRVVRDHTENPYPFMRKDGAIIVDELCDCGHLHSEHSPGIAGSFGSGECIACDCERYRWKRFILEHEAIAAFEAAREAGDL